MAGSTYTWIGGSGSADAPSNWSPTGGPNDGDTVIIPNGTVVADFNPNLVGDLVEIGGTGGVTAAAIFPGDSLTNFGTPTLDSGTVIAIARGNQSPARSGRCGSPPARSAPASRRATFGSRRTLRCTLMTC